MQLLRFCFTLVCGLICAQVGFAQQYEFTTLAGNTTSGAGDGSGTNAGFNAPCGITVDGAGCVYVSDYNNHTIRKITPGGTVSTLAGRAGAPGNDDGPGNNARFNFPRGVAVDNAGNVYVADTDNHIIRKVTPDGEVSTLAGSKEFYGSWDGTGSEARFFYPQGIAVDQAGDVYVADTGNGTIRRITPGGDVTTLAGRAGSHNLVDGAGSDARFAWPYSLAVKSADLLCVADTLNHAIRRLTRDGTNWMVSTVVAGLSRPSAIAVDSATNIYIVEEGNHTVSRITPGGVVSSVAGLAGTYGYVDGPGSQARFHEPDGIAVDTAGLIFVADTGNNTIRLGRPVPPLLSIHLVGGECLLSWPLAAPNYVLEFTGALSPSALWALVTDSVGTWGESFVVTNSPSGGARFFRLRLP